MVFSVEALVVITFHKTVNVDLNMFHLPFR